MTIWCRIRRFIRRIKKHHPPWKCSTEEEKERVSNEIKANMRKLHAEFDIIFYNDRLWLGDGRRTGSRLNALFQKQQPPEDSPSDDNSL